ncbi:MAG: TRAP transporter small permease [Desulforhopalus sp.]
MAQADLITNKLARAMHATGVYFTLPVLILLLTIDVSLRYIFSAPLLWGSEVSALILSLVFFAGLPQVTATKSHIRMDMLYRLMGPRIKIVSDTVAGLCGTLFSILLTYQSLSSCFEMYRWQQGAEMIELPYWPFVLFAGICGLLLTLQFTTQILLAFGRNGDEVVA